jgi:hypothetical protein
MEEKKAFLDAIADAFPHHSVNVLIYCDWLEEKHMDEESIRWRRFIEADPHLKIGYRAKYGYGNGDGDGNGYGYGYGDGDGDGNGYGNGYGYGYGDGNGDGNGYGNGDGYGKTTKGESMSRIGGLYVFMAPGWYVYAGKVIDQIGPYEYILEGGINILNNGGHGWPGWASGRRAGSRVQRCGEGFEVGGPFAGIYKLIGELPLAGLDHFDIVTL